MPNWVVLNLDHSRLFYSLCQKMKTKQNVVILYCFNLLNGTAPLLSNSAVGRCLSWSFGSRLLYWLLANGSVGRCHCVDRSNGRSLACAARCEYVAY